MVLLEIINLKLDYNFDPQKTLKITYFLEIQSVQIYKTILAYHFVQNVT